MYSSLSLSLCVAGPIVSFPDNGTVNLGSNLTLVCDVESNPPLMTVSITLNGQVLVNSTSEPLEYTIVRPQLDDNGDIYKCIAVNEINTTIEKFTLTVRGKRSLDTGLCVCEWPLLSLLSSPSSPSLLSLPPLPPSSPSSPSLLSLPPLRCPWASGQCHSCL